MTIEFIFLFLIAGCWLLVVLECFFTGQE